MSNFSRWLILIAGILMTVIGFSLFSTPIANSIAMTFVIICMMIVYGCVQIYHYIKNKKAGAASGLMLADGIISVVFGGVLLFVPGKMLAISIVFAFWVMFTGINRTTAAFMLRGAGDRNWGWSLAAGIIGIVLGIYLCMHPLMSIATVGYLLPMGLLFQGMAAICLFFTVGKAAK